LTVSKRIIGTKLLGQLDGYFADYDRQNINNAACDTYQVAMPIGLNPRLPPSSYNYNLRYTATHLVYKTQWQLIYTYDYGGNPVFPPTYGTEGNIVLPVGVNPVFSPPLETLQNILVGGGGSGLENSATYEYRLVDGFPVSWKVELLNVELTAGGDFRKPNYMSLITGYGLDPRAKPLKPKITPAEDGILKIGYYRQSGSEPVTEITTIEWVEYGYQLIAGQEITINLENGVLGTLYLLSGSYAGFNQIIALSTGVAHYRYADYLPNAIDQLFAEWLALYNTANNSPVSIPLPPNFTITYSETVTTTEISRVGKTTDVTKKWRQGNPIISDLIWSPIP
jgi:hypothetical protein